MLDGCGFRLRLAERYRRGKIGLGARRNGLRLSLRLRLDGFGESLVRKRRRRSGVLAAAAPATATSAAAFALLLIIGCGGFFGGGRRDLAARGLASTLGGYQLRHHGKLRVFGFGIAIGTGLVLGIGVRSLRQGNPPKEERHARSAGAT